MTKRTVIQVDEGSLWAASVRAGETGRQEHEIVEAALREYLGDDQALTLDGLHLRRGKLLAIAEAHGARNVRILGSVARAGRRDATATWTSWLSWIRGAARSI